MGDNDSRSGRSNRSATSSQKRQKLGGAERKNQDEDRIQDQEPPLTKAHEEKRRSQDGSKQNSNDGSKKAGGSNANVKKRKKSTSKKAIEPQERNEQIVANNEPSSLSPARKSNDQQPPQKTKDNRGSIGPSQSPPSPPPPSGLEPEVVVPVFRVTNPEIIPLNVLKKYSEGLQVDDDHKSSKGGSSHNGPTGSAAGWTVVKRATRKSIKSKSIAHHHLKKLVPHSSPSASPPPSQQKQPPPPPSSIEEEFYEDESLEFEQDETTFEDEDGYSYLEYESREDTFNDEDEEETEAIIEKHKSRGTLLREAWENISSDIVRTFDSPCRIFKLRGYHSEPDLSLPFEDKFDLKFEDHPPKRQFGWEEEIDSEDGGTLRKFGEKFVSCEDIAKQFSGSEYPDLVRGVLSEIKLRSYAIDDNMKNSWWELYDWERKRFSFYDELFAMGYVVDSLEVLSPPPKDSEGNPLTKGEYFVEAEEKHYRKKVDYGRVVFKTKHVYTGNFQDWYFEGPGRYCWQDGTIYQGEFSKGMMHGPGSIHWPDGCIYDGHFIYGKRTGWGVYSSADGMNTYAGEWLNGLPHGHGKMWYDPEDDDNDYYEGHWMGGLPEGSGTRQYSTGDRYVGNWVEGMRNGYGIMIWLQERQVYKGEWVDGVPNGFGKHIWYLERSLANSFPTRHVYQGNWVLGRREGIGKMVYPCGSVYEGRWKNGQRHGKGMFINPAGDLLVGLFRAGAILGGSDVPLHAPTYDCDYVGLTEWLTAKFKMPLMEDDVEEEKLVEITKKFLPYLRKLYHRAGEYSHKYGKHGLYPAYMKKSLDLSKTQGPANDKHHGLGVEDDDLFTSYHPEHHVHPREYSRLDEPEHMKGKVDKPDALDGVNPVTRFGLWLLIKDCDNVLDEVTMAYFDKIWCETPSLSFQTRHNPFEPVYLWQFLQTLIVASVAYFVDIPRLRQHQVDKSKSVMEPAAVSDTTLKGGVSYAEQRRAFIARHSRQNRHGALHHLGFSPTVDDTQTVSKGKGGHHHQRNKSTYGGKDKDRDDKKHHHKKHGEGKEPLEGGGEASRNVSKISAVSGERDGKMEKSPDKGNKQGNTRRSMAADGGTKRGSGSSNNDNKRTSIVPRRKTKELIIMERGSDSSKGAKGGGGATSEEEGLSIPEDDLEESIDPDENGDEEEGNVRKSVLFEGEENEEENEILLEGLPSPQGLSISECFEKFLHKKLLPCLRREAGSNLPMMPQPLPALVDMYDAFKGIKHREIVKGKEFLRSALPHRIFPNTKDALFWHRCPEPLSHQVDMDELLEMFRNKFEKVEDESTSDGNFEQKLESEYLGTQAQSSETTLKLLKLCKDNPIEDECPGAIAAGMGSHAPPIPLIDNEDVLVDLGKVDESDDLQPLADFTTEGHPFAEDELVPEPFLLADDYKCIPVRRKYQHFENINTRDVFNVLHQLYPKMCTGKYEKDLQFELIFCDWLWCISLLAKTSTERECRDAWRSTSDKRRPLTNPQSLGVYAHYIKQIKNNPYLSLTPPPDFVPKRKNKQNASAQEKIENEEKKAVKFS